MRKTKSIKFHSKKNSLNFMYKVKLFPIVFINFLVITISKFIPFLSIKNSFLSLIGIKIGKNVAIGAGVTFDFFFPELIYLDDNCLIGYNCLILTHEFLISECRYAPVKIGKNVMIGANSTILPGVTIGNNSSVSACSLVNKDIKPNSFVGGVPAKPIRKK